MLTTINCMRTNDKNQIELLSPFHWVQIEILVFDSNTWNHLSVYKQ